MFYRFSNGQFIEAETFEQAKEILLEQIRAETEDENAWHRCTCLGLGHRSNCPEMYGIIPF
jgi:hypothetical protein